MSKIDYTKISEQASSPKPGAYKDRSFLTGSQIYGMPTPDSDYDLVVLVSYDDLEKLSKGADIIQEAKHDESDKDKSLSSGSFRYGKMNLIAVTNEKAFAVWRQGTADLLALATERGVKVTRDEAIAHFQKLRKTAGL